jgi:hypothetical protein
MYRPLSSQDPNRNYGGGFGSASSQQQLQAHLQQMGSENQRKSSAMPESVSEMLRKRQMQKMRGSQ